MRRCLGGPDGPCHRLVTAGRCPQHQRATEAQRGSPTARGYDADWQRVRPLILERDHHECQIRGPRCTRIATTVDHVIPLAQGGARLDPSNLQAACGPCNSGKRDRTPTPEGAPDA